MTKKLEIASSKWKENGTTQLSEASLKRINDFHLTRLKLAEPQGAVSEAA